MDEINEKVRKELLSMQDIKYREFHSNLCTTCKYEFIGVRVPELRRLSKKIVQENFEDFLQYRDIKYYEEILLKGLVIGEYKKSLEKTCEYLKDFIPYIDNWAVCDITCSSLKITKKYMKDMWNFLQNYITSDKEYEIRFAVVMYLSYFIKEDFLKKIFNQLENLKNDEYYVKMAVAWFISIAYIKEKDLTLEFLKQTKIDNWTYNKAIQKMIESFRISESEKEMLKKMKR